jgi:hypothetical protein
VDKKQTMYLLLLTLLILGADFYLHLGITSFLSDFLVVFLVVGIVAGIIYSRGE